jgi:SAM-dependent methyltransferase
MPDTHWPDYYAVTVDRPAWDTVTGAADRFEADDRRHADARAAPDSAAPDSAAPDGAAPDSAAAGRAVPRLAVDLGCGAGRDTRELLRRGWRVLAVDAEAAAIAAVRDATPDEDLTRLETAVADIGTFPIPACDLVVASVSLQFLDAAAYEAVFERITAALPEGGRFAGYLYGDRDEAAGDPACTCPSADWIRQHLAAFELESWREREEDGHMALGDPHHMHLIEVVARRR